MQVRATTTRAAAQSSITPGSLLATATTGELSTMDPTGTQPARRAIDITAGRVLMTGIRDVREAGWSLRAATLDRAQPHTWGLVGFFREGDAWTAVELLRPTPEGGTAQLWSPFGLRDFRVADGLQLDAVWQVSHYGGDTRWGTPDSWIKPA